MSDLPNPWLEYKKAILDSRDDFSWVYEDLKGIKPSTNGWVVALCPFHEDKNPSFAFEKAMGHWKCQAGCGAGTVFDYIARTRDLSFRDSMVVLGDEVEVARPGSGGNIQTTFDYHDENGHLLFQVVKSPGKKFWQRRPDGKGGWIKSLKGVRRVLYRLPELISRPDDPVYIVEGEKDAERLLDLGLLATTSPGGAGKWADKYADMLSGRDIIILPDNDHPGRQHAVQIAESFRGKSKVTKVVELPGLQDKGDVSDWLDACGDRAQLEALVKQTKPVPEDDEPISLGEYPVIETHDRHLRDILDGAWSAVLAANDPPHVFNTAGCLGRLRDFGHGPQIEFLEERAATSLLARSADWIKTQGDRTINTKPPKEAASELIVNPHKDLPKLDSVITTPVFDRDWRLITQPGYHPENNLWFHQPGGTGSYAISGRPTPEEVEAALSLILDDLLVDFPFTAESDKAHAVAALLLPFVRWMFDGPTPIHLIEAPTPGSGKSLLAELISIIALGGSPGCTTLTSNEEENRKKLTALLSRGSSVISIDNLQGGLWSAQVAAAITAEIWEDRILGQTRMVTFQNRALWMVSANNPKLSMEIARRCIRIRIDPGDEQPWKRTGFKHDPIREWAKQNRRQLVQAILTLIQHWIMSGAPHSCQTMGSFETWSRVIGGMIQQFGLPGFLDDTDEFYDAADPESGEWRAFVEAWWDAHQGTPVSGRDLLQLALDNDLVAFAYAAKSEQSQRARFGRSLSGLRDRWFGDHQVVVGMDSHKKVRIFRLVPVEKVLFK